MECPQEVVRAARGGKLQASDAKAEEDLFSGRVWTGRQVGQACSVPAGLHQTVRLLGEGVLGVAICCAAEHTEPARPAAND